MTRLVSTTFLLLALAGAAAGQTVELFARGEGFELDTIPANERGIVALARDEKGRIYGGTAGRAAHLFVFDPAAGAVRSLARLEGGIGLSSGLVQLADGSFLAGTQADPTGTALSSDPSAVGRLYRFVVSANGPARWEDLGVPVAGQGIHALAYLEAAGVVVGNTWPDGHFFSYNLKTRTFRDHGAIAGHRTFETPRRPGSRVGCPADKSVERFGH
jgi:hypothetical protein